MEEEEDIVEEEEDIMVEEIVEECVVQDKEPVVLAPMLDVHLRLQYVQSTDTVNVPPTDQAGQSVVPALETSLILGLNTNKVEVVVAVAMEAVVVVETILAEEISMNDYMTTFQDL